MARRFDRDALKQGVALRRRFLTALVNFTNKTAEQTATDLEVVGTAYQNFAFHLGDLDEAASAEYIADAIQGAVYICRWTAATLQAAPDASRYIDAAKAHCVLLQERLSKETVVNTMDQSLFAWTNQVLQLKTISQVAPILSDLGQIQLPVFYSRGKSRTQLASRNDLAEPTLQQSKTAVVKLMFALDAQTLITPQAIRSSTQHDFQADLATAIWPEKFDLLQIDYVSTMAPDAYFLTPFTFKRADGDRQSQKGHAVFHHAQTLLSDPASIKVRARFLSRDDEQTLPATVVGHSELKLRVLNENSYPVLSGYSTIDIQIPKLVQDVWQALPNLNPRDVDDFTRCLIYLSRYAGMVLQSGVFKGRKVNEPRDFQQHLLSSLRMTELSSEVTEGERTSGGILDLRYRNIVIELKVETGISDRSKLRAAYIEQPAQYTVHAIPLSIACILDMTEKEHPPSNIANNITLETPVLHGFEGTPPIYPSKVAVIIIDGNIKSPSVYS